MAPFVATVCGGSSDYNINGRGEIGGIESWFRRRFDGDRYGGSSDKGSGSYHKQCIILVVREFLEGGLGGGGFLTILCVGCPEVCFKGR